MEVQELVGALRAAGYTNTQLAAAVGASADSVERWGSGQGRPRPSTERLLRLLGDEQQLSLSVEGAAGLGLAEHQLDRALRELREALHRRGRLSSRNEALDEAARLIFAHTVSLRSGGRGIGVRLLSATDFAEAPAQGLRDFVAGMAAQHLPVSLAHEMSVQDFHLQLKPQEDELAFDILKAFEHFFAGSAEATLSTPAASDLINHAFGRFLADSFIDEKELGQYLTPPEVVQFMVNLALGDLTEEERRNLSDPADFQNFGYVLDPSCGVGSFLAEFVRAAHLGLADSLPTSAFAAWPSEAAENLVVGIDKSERMVRLALANLATFGTAAARLHLANGLARSGRDGAISADLEGRVGLILTNPPFGATFAWDEVANYRIATHWATKTPTTLDSELLFMERYIDWLRPNGQLLAVVPDSILTNKGLFADLRRGLAPEVEVRTVVSLPSVTFAAAGTSTKTSIIHLRKGRRNAVARFAVCHDIGYSVSTRGSQRRKVHDSEGELPEILSQLSGGGGSLVHEAGNIDEAGRWDANYNASLSPEFLSSVARSDGFVRVSDVAELVQDRVDPRRDPKEFFNYIEISNVIGEDLSVTSKSVPCAQAPSRARLSVRAGDVLVSTVRPERRTIGVVPHWLDGAVCTTGFAVLRPHGIHPLVLASLLREDLVTEQVLRNNIGIAYPAIESSCLPEVILPVTTDTSGDLVAAAEALEDARRQLWASREHFNRSMSDAVAAWLVLGD